MQFATRKVTASAMTTVALMTVTACDQTMEPTAVGFKPTVNFATALLADQQIPRYPIKRVGEEGGRPVFKLDRVCDVFIGEPVPEGAEAPQRYAHQAVVVEETGVDAEGNVLWAPLPEGSIVRLDATEAQAPGMLFTCDADDPDLEGLQPVIDPVTLHAAKGDAPQVITNGVTLDLNGYSITVTPSPFLDPTADPAFENIGVVLAGEGQTLTNSAAVQLGTLNEKTGRPFGVSYIFGFGHNVDVEAVSPTVQGTRVDANPDEAITDWVYNIETRGGFGIRLSSGTMTIDQVKSVNNADPVDGQGFEARRISSGFLTVSNSHFEGAGEGAFLREVSGVTFTGNYVASTNGPAIVTRQARSQSGRAILITNNVVGAGTTGILWGRESTSSGNLKIEGNVLLNAGCSIGLSSRNALSSISPYSLSSTAINFIGNVNHRDMERTVKATTCRVGD